MKRLIMLMAVSFVGCMLPADDAPAPGEAVSTQAIEAAPDGLIFQTCAEAGCPNSPSGSPDIWEPCTVTYPCFCDTRPAPGGIVRCLQPPR